MRNSPAASDAGQRHRWHVLLVEDNPGDAELAQERLLDASAPDIALQHAATLAEALQALQDAPADAVILDLNLPDSRGVDTVRRLKEQAPETPMLVVTGLVDARLRQAVVAAGAEDLYAKDETNSRLFWRAVLQVAQHHWERRRLARASEERLAALLDNAPIGMAVGPAGGAWRYVNPALARLLDRTPQALLTLHPRALCHPDDAPPSDDAVAPVSEERWSVGADGADGWLWVRVTRGLLPASGGEGPQVITQVESIEDRVQREQLTQTALAEKETLLREVYHRVKNNLQVIQSLINLKRGGLADGDARQALAETAERVRAMALVHEKLYQSERLSRLDLADYLKELCSQLHEALRGDTGNVRVALQLEPVAADLQAAVPFGLVVTELMSNCFKHAFVGRPGGTIHVTLAATAGGGMLTVADDGVGWNPAEVPATSLGIRLVHSLARQLDARALCEAAPGRGTCWRLQLPSFNAERPGDSA